MSYVAGPDEIFKHCFKCAASVIHRRVPGIKSRALYQCANPCGAQAREVTDSFASAPEAVESRAKLAIANTSAVKEQIAQLRRHAYKPKENVMPKQKALPPLIAEINRIVDARVTTMDPEVVRKIVREELAALTGLSVGAAEAKFVCSRPPHRGPHGKKCREAAGLN